MNLPSRLYLDFYCAVEYPQQEPAYCAARWRDVLWLLVPIGGFILFVTAVEGRYRLQK